MLFFRNDYGKGCIPEILELLNTTNNDAHIGYGQDSICERAKEVIHSKDARLFTEEVMGLKK